ncbi:hypothetical protein OTU49_001105, partial [Cherax quadricarinatus]
QMVNYMEGTGSWFDISARDADQFVDYGDDFQWKDGYDTLITYLKESIPDSAVKLSSPVCKIFWDEPAEERVLVVTLTGDAYLASHVIVTASVAHLQERHTHIFHPALPQSLVNALMVVLWAGEHTHNTRYSTVDGAMETGKHEALKIISKLKPSSSSVLVEH